MNFSPMVLLAGVVFGIAGIYVFRSGRREFNSLRIVLGLGLMIYPYFISSAWLTWLVGTALLGAVYLTR
ncbi:MAG: hypothetical protein JST16_12405 [Bdellovibrionales bacterium]|nr:hypothetical protein [Bdellovibrionales bacterium]